MYSNHVQKMMEGGEGVEERQHRLLSLLRKESDYKGIQFFADCLEVSERTVRHDIVALNALSQGRYSIVSRRGVGVKLLVQAELRKEPSIQLKLNMSVEERRLDLLAHLLVLKQRVSINQMAERYRVSRSSIQNDLKWIRDTFSEASIESGKAGTNFAGSASQLLEALMTFNTLVIQQHPKGQSANLKEQKEALVAYYDEQLVQATYETVLALLQKDTKLLAEYNVYNVFNVLLSLVNCLYLQLHPEVEEAFEDSWGTVMAETLLEEISQQVEVDYSKSDSQLLAKYLISNRLVSMDADGFNQELVEQVIAKLNKVFNVQQSDDPVFDEQVRQHVTLMIFRLRNELGYSNPFIKDIKEKWSLSFNMIWLVMREFEEALQVTFSEHEIGFLVVYYQPYIDVSDKSRILVICQHGVAATQLIASKLKRHLPSSVSISSTASFEVNDQLLASYDFIVSTVQFESASPKVIYVESLIDDDFLEDLRSKMTRPMLDGAHFVRQNLGALKPFLQPDFIFLNKKFKTKADLLTFARYALTGSNYVSQAFMDSVEQREKQGSTLLGNGVAIPHGNPMEVERSIVMVLSLDEAIKWDKGFVDLVFLVCIAKADARHLKGIMSAIYSLVSHQAAIEFIQKSPNKQTLYEAIGGSVEGKWRKKNE